MAKGIKKRRHMIYLGCKDKIMGHERIRKIQGSFAFVCLNCLGGLK